MIGSRIVRLDSYDGRRTLISQIPALKVIIAFILSMLIESSGRSVVSHKLRP